MHGGQQLAYVTHSGLGHQLQMLLRGLFLAHLTGRKLLLPPMMTHRGNLVINGEKGCMGTAQKWEYRVKDSLLLRSNKNLADKCATEADSFASVFDLARFAYREHGCGQGHSAPCAVVHYSATKLHNKTGTLCDQPPPCDELLARVAQRADELAPAPDPPRGQYYHGIRQVANYRANNGTLCLGPLNQYFVRGMLHACGARPAETASPAYAAPLSPLSPLSPPGLLATELATRGLPLRAPFLRRLQRAMPAADGCVCLYTRLDDRLSGKTLKPSPSPEPYPYPCPYPYPYPYP